MGQAALDAPVQGKIGETVYRITAKKPKLLKEEQLRLAKAKAYYSSKHNM